MRALGEAMLGGVAGRDIVIVSVGVGWGSDGWVGGYRVREIEGKENKKQRAGAGGLGGWGGIYRLAEEAKGPG